MQQNKPQNPNKKKKPVFSGKQEKETVIEEREDIIPGKRRKDGKQIFYALTTQYMGVKRSWEKKEEQK